MFVFVLVLRRRDGRLAVASLVGRAGIALELLGLLRRHAGSGHGALASLVGVQLGRRRGGRVLEHGLVSRDPRSLDPRQLEREAAEAERAGDFERALRLLFLADYSHGLLRVDLDRADRLQEIGQPVRERLGHLLKAIHRGRGQRVVFHLEGLESASERIERR